MLLRLRVAALFSALAVAACGTTGKIVSSTPDSVAVQVADANKLEVAFERANQYCEERGRRADLKRTEEAGETLVGYFTCA